MTLAASKFVVSLEQCQSHGLACRWRFFGDLAGRLVLGCFAAVTPLLVCLLRFLLYPLLLLDQLPLSICSSIYVTLLFGASHEDFFSRCFGENLFIFLFPFTSPPAAAAAFASLLFFVFVDDCKSVYICRLLFTTSIPAVCCYCCCCASVAFALVTCSGNPLIRYTALRLLMNL